MLDRFRGRSLPNLFLMDPTRTTTASYLSPESTMPSWDFGHDYGASPPNILAVMGGHHRSAAPLNNGANFLFCTSSPSCVVLRACCAVLHKRPPQSTSPLIYLPLMPSCCNVRFSPSDPTCCNETWACLTCLMWMEQRGFVGSQIDQDDQNDRKQ